MAQDHAQHDVTLGENAEQLAIINHGDGAHGVFGHCFHGLKHTCMRRDGSGRNAGYLEETHRGLRANEIS
jgi:hypothetical protein